jgi:signal transduction histidine kinase
MPRIPILASLTNRIFAATALLVVLAVGITTVFITDRVTAEAEVELRRGLAEAARAVDHRSDSLSATSLVTAKLVADLPKLKAAMATGDGPTVLPVAREYRAMLPDADLVAVTDAGGRALAVDAAAPDAGRGAAPWPSVAAALGGVDGIAYEAHPAGVRQVVSVPVTLGRTGGELAGTLSIAYLFDARLAAQFKALTGSEITFALGGVVRASTLPRAHWASLGARSVAPGDTHVQLGEDEYVARAQPVGHGGARVSGAAATAVPVVIVARSRSERLRFLDTIRAVTFGTVLAAVLAATLLSYGVARTITRPLAAITDTMRDVAATGDLTRRIPVRTGRWEDEDARLLASTFNGLIDAVARFELEAAQRERLSALGRLSSVIAHEIRNPLMIIKASVRTLRTDGSAAPPVLEAAQDIDEEVGRLNRLVNDVLDFARPIAFELAPADVNDVCLAAVRAVSAADPGVDIRFEGAPDLSPVTTDAERVRGVLVNAVTNAAQAVRAARAAGRSVPPGTPDVTVGTTPLGDGGVRIVVRDTGTGIEPDLLPRVFEPFVTTRRGGTGLGLAIARNTIEGLGGRIGVTSAMGAGTTLGIELPAQPASRAAAPPAR